MPNQVSFVPAIALLGLLFTVGSSAGADTVKASTGDLEAVIPVEVLPVDASLATGKISGGSLIALQPARIARGIVTDAGKVLVLAVVGKPERDSEGRLRLDIPSQQAWCTLPIFGQAASRCFQDSDGDGKLDAARKGLLAAASPLTLSRVEASESITPIPYREAREDELPRYRVGYASCNGSKMENESQYRFATSVRPAGGVFWPLPTLCSDIAKPLDQRDGDDPVFQFGRFKVAVAKQKDSIETRLVEGIPAGTLLGHLALDEPLMDAADATTTLASKLDDDRPFLFFSSPPDIAESAGKNQNLLRAGVSHGLVGKLASPLTRYNGFLREPTTWPIGTPVFGVVMKRVYGPKNFAPKIVWCIPERDAKGHWDTQCVSPNDRGAVLVEAYPSPFAVTGLSPGSGSPLSSEAIVERGPADFGEPLRLAIQFDGVDKRYVNLQWGVGPEGEPMTNRLRLGRANDGSGYLFVAGMIIKVQPSQDGTTATITKFSGDYRADVDALPTDAVALFGKSKR